MMLNSKKWEVKPRGKSSQSGRQKPQAPVKRLDRLSSGHRISSATGGAKPPVSKNMALINDHLSKIN